MRNVDGASGGGLQAAGFQALNASTTPKAAHDSLQQPLRSSDLDTIWSWNACVPPSIPKCMHDLFTEQARRTPDHVAVQSWDGDFTYSQLNDLSTRLALHLRDQGIKLGARIPLCFEKSKWAVVALLGVLKSGATVSLTDPSQPEARLRTIVEQTGATLIITSAAQKDLGEGIAIGGNVLAVNQDFFNHIPLSNSSSILQEVPASSPMYIIFTSGSTGKPKGVVISHENYTSGSLPRAEAVGYKSTSRVFDFPSYAFDVSLDCMLCTLAVGGTVCVPSEEMRMDNLSGAIRQSEANMVHMTPSVARVLDEDIIPSLDVLGLGGEAVGARDAAAWGAQTNLVIAYGPSECTVGCTINNTVSQSTGIGVGVGGVTWIVDPEDHDRLTPLGETGELLVEGPLVGIGYLDEPEKTSQVFIENPAWLARGNGNVPGRSGRLYKTGDLVKYEEGTTNGSIEFVGRKDQQVKLRGQRVELAEVEYHVRLCLPQGVQVAAEVIKPVRGSPTLVAFLAEMGNHEADPDSMTTDPSHELAEALKTIESLMAERIPRYMVPASFITLRTMPTLVSGKTDRKRLREIGASICNNPARSNTMLARGDKEAQTDFEKKLQRAWTKVLGTEVQISQGSSFFALGGDSLKAMRLVSAAREEQMALTVADIFSCPTLSDMALRATSHAPSQEAAIKPFALLDSNWDPQAARSAASSLCGVDTELIEDVYPCTPLQEALMALSAKVKEAYVAQRVVELADAKTADRLVRAFSQAARETPILRTRIVQVPGHGLVQVVINEELSCTRGDDLTKYLSSDRDASMTLGSPLVRYAIIEEKTRGTVSFVLTIHHALYDGWSMPLIIERVNKAYNSQSLSRPAGFRHFINYLQGLDPKSSEAYWRQRLEGAYPNQFPRLPRLGYQVKPDALLEEYVALPSTLPDNITVATLIRAAWALVTSSYTGTWDVIFGETLTGRNAPVMGAEEIEGPMITTIPFRTQINPESSVSEYLQQVQTQSVGQIPHEHYGLQHIRRVSPDAREACELGTGLVLHPKGEKRADTAERSPADLLVPAGDKEAAEEALKFNTYALMLVCSIDPKGFLVMASFDTNTAEVQIIHRMLKQMAHVVQQLSESATAEVGELNCLLAEDMDALRSLHSRQSRFEIDSLPPAEGAYVVNEHATSCVLPLGAPGRLILRSTEPLDLQEVPKPALFGLLDIAVPPGCFFDTGKSAIMNVSGHISLVAAPATTPLQAPGHRVEDSAMSNKQRALRTIWSRVLKVAEADIGLEDSFFLLGGDSIFAMKLVSEARAEGMVLTVMQIFDNRSLQDMASILEEKSQADDKESVDTTPFALLGRADGKEIASNILNSQFAKVEGSVLDVYPARPLQSIAVKGTVQIPRFSVRYELIKFKSEVSVASLRLACQELVARNEILRTVFVEHDSQTYGAVLDKLEAQFVEYEVEGDVDTFCHQLCRLDVMTRMPYGSSFVKWFFVRGNGQSCLVFRISHAQYDEMCLPIMLRQLSSLYEGKPVPDSLPFSKYVAHVLKDNIPASIPYWQDLLSGASLAMLKPDIPITETRHFATEQSVDLTGWSSETTFASLPTAAWALTLSRRLSTQDVFFGEVVSGRNTSFPDAASVTGPCWQYLPFRIRMSSTWTGRDLLRAVQRQHVSSSAHEGMALNEIAELCNLPGLSSKDWYGSVVHQAVKAVESLDVNGAGGTTETVYVHEEPLHEWNLQAFIGEGEMTLELITVESWKDYAEELLTEVAKTARSLVVDTDAMLFPAA